MLTKQQTVPTSTTILVIGGGPAGSYAASVLAREGLDVTVLERDIFPRYHIGESMLPSCNAFLKFIGCVDKIRNAGFAIKPGAAIKLNQHKREGYNDFISIDPSNIAWNVVRSEYDDILFKHAAENDAKIFDGIAVKGIIFSSTPDESGRPVAAEWSSKEGSSGEISFDWLVDASGRNGIMSTTYLKNRKFNQSLKNVAHWAYWSGANIYAPGTKRENAPWFEALVDESGWAWFIPLYNGTVSVGVVILETASRAKKAAFRDLGDEAEVKYYLSELQLAPGLVKLLGSARLMSEVRHAGDYSYSATTYGGSHFRIAGDAGAFIDPFFSSGVHLAFTGALSAACSIAASIRGHCTETEALAFHNYQVTTSYTRFLVAVLAAYKQIRAQSDPVLSDVDEDNFDRAFHFLAPVIQGATEADGSLTQSKLQAAVDFCQHAIAPCDPDMFPEVSKRFGEEVTSLDGPILGTSAVDVMTGTDADAKHVIWKMNANKALNVMYDSERSFRTEVFNGFVANLERGTLGLKSIRM